MNGPVTEATYLDRLRTLWRTNWPKGVPDAPRYPLGEIPLTGYLREWAQRTPDKPAVLFYGREVSYAEPDRLSDRFAAWLARHGVQRGDRIAVFLPNCPQFLI